MPASSGRPLRGTGSTHAAATTAAGGVAVDVDSVLRSYSSLCIARPAITRGLSMSSSSTSKTSAALGGMTPPAPVAP